MRSIFATRLKTAWPYKYSKEFLDETIRVWQPLSKEPLTYQDAVEIIDNAVGFYGTLLRCAREAERRKAAAQ